MCLICMITCLRYETLREQASFMPNGKGIRTKPPFFSNFGFVIFVVVALRGSTSS